MHDLPTQNQTTATQRTSNFSFLANHINNHKLSYFTGVVFLFLTNWFAVSIPKHIGQSIDLLSSDLATHSAELKTHILLIIVFALSVLVIRTVSRILFFNPGRAIEKEVKDEAFGKLTKLQKPFYDSHQTGSLISIVNNDINGVRALCGVIFMQFFNILFALSITPYQMWQLSSSLTIYCFLPVLITFFVAHKATDFIRKQTRLRMTELQGLSSQAISCLSGIDVIKSNAVHDWAKDTFAKEDKALLKRSLALTKAQTLALPIIEYTDRLMKLLIIGVGGYYLIQQELTIGELTAFLSYATLLAMPFISMGRVFSGYRIGMASVDSIRRILDLETDKQDRQRLNESERNALFTKGLEIRNLSFQYPGESRPALKNISFSISPGEKVGVLGRVGSGKTTLVNCLNRYLDASAGDIFLDGIETRSLARADLRSAVRTVTQDPFLFSASVEDNIVFGANEDTDSLTLEDTLYLCNMDKEVAKFPKRENTVVGEKGILLSGGQKQRLSLARAFFTPCKLIVLDNVLSAVDNQTERFLLDQILNNLRSKSTLIVSHRASVLEQLDRILVLEDGEIIAQGSHDELLNQCDLYKETWNIQQKSNGEVAT